MLLCGCRDAGLAWHAFGTQCRWIGVPGDPEQRSAGAFFGFGAVRAVVCKVVMVLQNV
jgi:hypothetical protein